jgi:SAM-dependent methyltransferase
MAKAGEIANLQLRGEAAIRVGLGKPFSCAACPNLLMRIGVLMGLLPPPPCRLLDLGCGIGWTSIFFARKGYDVVGVDIAPDKIAHANVRKAREEVSNVHFRACDYEELAMAGEFDCAVFFDSLHHAVDEELALRCVCNALKPGGVCVTSEPGVGHAQRPGAMAAMKQFDVTEKDMPPWLIARTATRVGFESCRCYLPPWELWQAINQTGWDLGRGSTLSNWVRTVLSVKRLFGLMTRRNTYGCVTVLRKGR